MQRLIVSANRRFLVHEDGTPFFWLGDTAWELFHRLTVEEAAAYLDNRQRKGFTVIQAVALAELDGLNVPNANGDRPLHDNDPCRPNDRYFAHVDRVIQLAADRGLRVGLLPTWGDKIELLGHGIGPVIFDPGRAAHYGEWIGRRFRDCANLIWINGGDRRGDGVNAAVWHALGTAIKQADPNHLMTFHPPGGDGGHSSSEWFHHASWLDFNLAQSGHESRDTPRHALVARDYALAPTKPCLDGEPCYEDHPVNWRPAEGGHFEAIDVRRAAYQAVFAGACGHTYGCHPVWQFLDERRAPIGLARRPWREALDLPAAAQMGHLRRLIESRPMLSRVPDAAWMVDPGEGPTRRGACRGDGYGFVHLPAGGAVTLQMTDWRASHVRAWWYDPANGEARDAGLRERLDRMTFTPPEPDAATDVVLVLDEPTRGFPAPGSSGFEPSTEADMLSGGKDRRMS